MSDTAERGQETRVAVLLFWQQEHRQFGDVVHAFPGSMWLVAEALFGEICSLFSLMIILARKVN